ncbi:MAG: sigma-70 family RNA polymerase sigma factor [Bacteroidota bacterium]
MMRILQYSMNKDLIHIIYACRKKEPAAQNELYRFTYERLLNCTLRYTKSVEEGQWVFNLAMLKVFRHLDRFNLTDPKSNYLAWAKDILIKTSIDHLRKNINYRKLLIPTEIKDYNDRQYDLNTALDDLATEAIFALIQTLIERERLIFSMYEIDGFSHRKIEALTEIKSNTSKWLLAKAKKSLRQKLNQQSALKLKNNG